MRGIQSVHPLTARQVKRIHVAQRENPIVNRLNKTREEKQPDLQQERLDRAKELRGREQAARQARQNIEHVFRVKAMAARLQVVEREVFAPAIQGFF